LINSCPHRGTQVCRADAGNSKRFTCAYHGWSFNHDGSLIATSFEHLMPENMDKQAWGMRRLPRVERYKGLIFGSLNVHVEPLSVFLGDFTFYLDAFFGRTPGGMTVIAPPHRLIVRTNWKVGALNFLGDGMHLQTTHAGPLSLDPVRSIKNGLAVRASQSVQVIVDGRHGCNLNYLGPGLPEHVYETRPEEIRGLFSSELSNNQLRLLKDLRVGVGTIFPNLSFIETQVTVNAKALVLRLWHPLSVDKMEMLSWTLAESESTEDYRQLLLSKGMHNFGAAGVFEQDDIELWESGSLASRSLLRLNHKFSFLSAVPFRHEPLSDYFGPGRVYSQTLTEISQLEFMTTWQTMLNNDSEAYAS
jgi:PAH dioxygenase large subunit